MASRKGKTEKNAGDSYGQVLQLNNDLRGKLRELTLLATQVDSSLKDANQVQSELEERKPLSLIKGRLDKLYDYIDDQTQLELRSIEASLSLLDTLLELDPEPALAAVPPRAANRKRLRADSGDGTESPSSVTNSIPSPVMASHPSPVAHPTRLGSTHKSKAALAKQRKHLLEGQLPLAIGRHVAFKLPNKIAAKEEWILARVIDCLQGDKNRYAVEDVDYDPKNPIPEQGKYNTTLKAIVPLPNPKDRFRTYPHTPYAPGTPVLALYPDTTSFYRAYIESGPEYADKRKPDSIGYYRVKFEDDDDLVRQVQDDLVVEAP